MTEQSAGAPCGSHKLPRGFYSASSSSSVTAEDDYDVFLNHRGPDVKGCFVSHLYYALKAAGLNPFLDKKSLVKGGHASESIDAALKVAKVHVAVVSKGYADSKHCLNELVAMMRSGKRVIPVFYDVKPAHLRQTKRGLFKKAFRKHNARERAEQVEEWADALAKLANTTGHLFRLSDHKGDEAELKQEVVDAILRKMPLHEDLLIDPHLVGMEDHLKTCINKLEKLGSGTSFLGLVGMGGIGKSTLAKVIYQHLLRHGKRFQASSFLEIDRDGHSGKDVTSRLQRQLLWDLLNVSDYSYKWYEDCLRKLSKTGPVLIVIDDLCDKSQFDELILNARHLACGSCIIATSRDRDALSVIGGASKCPYDVHDVAPLEEGASRRLFNWHAFGDEEAPEKFKALADNVSKACSGLPLALKAIGSSLYNKRSDEDLACIWPEAIGALRENLNVMGALKWSYNQLSNPEKLMFVDVASVFFGWKKDEALEIWKGCEKCCRFTTPHTYLNNLIDKSLVQLRGDRSDRPRLVMHSLLRDMGQSIGSVNGSHVWEDGVVKVVEDQSKSTHRLRALNLANNNTRTNLEVRDLKKFNNLHYLVLDGCHVNGSFGSVCKELRWLQWRNMPLQQAPLSMLDLSNMISLDFSESTMLANIWTRSDPAMGACPNLLRLNLKGCTSITTLPDSIGLLSQLQVLDLVLCRQLNELPSSIGHLTSLQRLYLGGCGSLKALPDSIIGLSCLQGLALEDCRSLSRLPMSLGLMESLSLVAIDLATAWQATTISRLKKALKVLKASRCNDEAITAIDSSGALMHVDQLWFIEFYESPLMTKLPETMGLLNKLEYMELLECVRVRELPKSIGNLKVLRQLLLRECHSLESLPESMGALSSLEILVLSKCTSITTLPSSIGNLSRLCDLEILGCRRLQSLPESLRQLNALYFLSVMECGGLESLGILRIVEDLGMWGRTTMSKLPGSCLMVVDSNRLDPSRYYDYNVKGYYPMQRDLKVLQLVEGDDCRFLRVVDDGTSRLILQRVYIGPCL